jgi:hypothetical protein
MSGPRPEQCSHRIQVAQRAQNFEEAEKVNTVPHQDTVPNLLHSYTSGIGFLLLPLPRHIHRITGDIPSLLSPLTFDCDEPVDLIIATYVSVLFGLG